MIRRSGLQLRSALSMGLVLAGTGAGAATRAEAPAQPQAAVPVSDVPDDAPDLLEFLGSPEADPDLWKAFLEILPDQLEEIVPANAEVSGTRGVDE